MTELSDNTIISQIQIADEVIAVIAGTSALEVDGVVAMSGIFKGDVSEMLGKKNLSKGIRVAVTEGAATIDITVTVKFGYKIPEVCKNLQSKIKNAVETMTGLAVAQVNVFVNGITQEKETVKNEKS